MFTFLFVLCLPDTPQCFRMEPEAPTPHQCEELTKLLHEVYSDRKDVYIGECVELDME